MPSSAGLRSPNVTRRLAFARLRTAHDVTMRELVHSSWDTDGPAIGMSPSGSSWRGSLRRPPPLPPRSATDVSGAALHAARLAESLAEKAAQDAADAADAARKAIVAAEKAAAYAASFATPDPEKSARSFDLARYVPSETRDADEECLREEIMRSGSVELDAQHVESISEGDGVTAGSDSAHMCLPVPVPVPLGKMWSVDVVATWHNAIRLELRDLFLILDCVSARRPGGSVTRAELRALFAWFSTFEAFLVTGLKAEEEVLFPWLEQWGRIDGELSTASRITAKGAIIRGIRDTAACSALLGLDRDMPSGMVLTNPDRMYYDGLKVGYAELAPSVGSVTEGAVCGGVLRKVTEAVASFSTQLLEYFHEQERSLPVIIESLYDPEDMHSASIERRMMRAIWKCGRKDESMIMLLRAVEDSPTSKQWICRNMRRLERVAMALWRRRYSNARGAVVAKFKERKRFWERTAASLDVPHGSSLHRFNLMSPTARSTPANIATLNYPLAQTRSFGTSSSSDNNFPTGRGT